MEDYEQSYSVSSGTVPDPQYPERNIQLAGTGLPSTLDEGTRKSQLLPEGKKTDPKDLVGNIQPIDTGLPSTVSDKGAAKTMPLPKEARGDKDSEELKPSTDMEPLTNHVADPSGTHAKYQADQTQSARSRYRSLTENKGKTSSEVEPDIKALQLKTFVEIHALLLSNDEMVQESDDEDSPPNTDRPESSPSQETQESDSNPSKPELKKYDNILPLTERQLVKYLRKVSRVLFNKLTKDQWEKHEEVATATDKTNLLKALNGVTETLKVIQNVVKDDPTLNKKSSFEFLQATALRQEEHLASWAKKGKGIATEEQLKPFLKKLVPASKEVRPDLDAPILVPYEINGKNFQLTEEQIQAHMDKEEQINKSAEEAKRLEMTKTEAGEKFKKAQDAEMQVLKREHSQKGQETDVVHSPFKFSDFGVTELDELGPIIQKKKNTIVKDLMTSLRKRKRKHMELEPEIKVHGFECNRSLPEGVPFINNMVIKELEYVIFFTDVFGDQAFKRWNDIHKVRVDSLVEPTSDMWWQLSYDSLLRGRQSLVRGIQPMGADTCP
ncbi:hypothetical protein Tco_1141776 [Tanacetum coccineum]